MNIKSLFFLCIILYNAFNTEVFPNEKTNRQPERKKWNVSFGLSSYYDDNVLRNSDKYLDRFTKGQDEGRFHIEKYDDLVMEFNAGVSFTDVFYKKLITVFTAGVEHNSFTYNPVKTWSSFEAGIQQYISKSASLSFSYNHIPEYYIKHYRDYDWLNIYGAVPESFKPYSFSKNSFDFQVQNNFTQALKVKAYFSLMNYYYNEHFTEYDSRNYMIGLRGYHSFSKKISTDLWYRYITSDAKGYDQKGENKNTSDEGDASFNEHNITAALSAKLPDFMKIKNSARLAVQYASRDYTTEKTGEEDRIHSGRNDNYYSAEISLTAQLTKSIFLSGFFRWIYRDADTDVNSNKVFLSDEKDYRQNLAGISLKYNINF